MPRSCARGGWQCQRSGAAVVGLVHARSGEGRVCARLPAALPAGLPCLPASSAPPALRLQAHPPSTPSPPHRYGTFEARAYRSLLDGTEHLALVHGDVSGRAGVLARVHSESMLGDLLGAERCDSGSQLDAALRAIVEAGAGVLVYLRGQQGRGLGLAEELEAYARADASPAACSSPAALEDGTFPVGSGGCWIGEVQCTARLSSKGGQQACFGRNPAACNFISR